MSVGLSVSLSLCLFLDLDLSACFSMRIYVLRMSVFLYVCAPCMSVPLRLLLVPLRLCTDEHVIVAIFRLNTSS